MENLVQQAETWSGEAQELQSELEQQSKGAGSEEERLQSTSSEETSARRKSWNELRGVVSDLRRRMSGMSAGSVPSSITFRSLPDGR
jgi:polyhydroxyalkanoate synthesis regulator phasin